MSQIKLFIWFIINYAFKLTYMICNYNVFQDLTFVCLRYILTVCSLNNDYWLSSFIWLSFFLVLSFQYSVSQTWNACLYYGWRLVNCWKHQEQWTKQNQTLCCFEGYNEHYSFFFFSFMKRPDSSLLILCSHYCECMFDISEFLLFTFLSLQYTKDMNASAWRMETRTFQRNTLTWELKEREEFT